MRSHSVVLARYRGGRWLASLTLVAAMAGACAADEAPKATGSEAATEPVTAEPVSSESVAPSDLLPNGIEAEPGLLVGGQPSVEQLDALRESGYVTVVNLRGEGEGGTGAAEVEAAGLTYVALPIPDAEAMSEENARRLANVLDEAEGPVVLHCGSGNRVGGLLALKAFYVDGLSADEAIQYGLDSGLTRLEGVVRERLAAAAPTQ